MGIGMVFQNFMHIDDMSILENIILGNVPTNMGLVDYEKARRDCQKYIDAFGLKCSLDEKISGLSVGERQKIEIIKTLYLGARILILDEPTAVLTPQESQELFKNIADLKRDGKSVVFISHKLREVMEVADRITVMKKGEVTGVFEKEDASEIKLARAMIGKQDVELLQNLSDDASNEVVLSLDKLWTVDSEGIPRLRDLSFDLYRGEILGIGGVEGNGQKELQELIIGLYPPSAGKIYLDGNDISQMSISERRSLGISLIPEDRMTMGLSINSNIQDNLLASRDQSPEFNKHGFLDFKNIKEMANNAIKEFDIRGANLSENVGKLSGGNLQKVILARELANQPKVIIASQPTRGLDIGAINTVRTVLLDMRKKSASILLISADLEELMSLSDRVLILFGGKIAGEVTRDQIRSKQVTESDIGLLMGGAHADFNKN